MFQLNYFYNVLNYPDCTIWDLNGKMDLKIKAPKKVSFKEFYFIHVGMDFPRTQNYFVNQMHTS